METLLDQFSQGSLRSSHPVSRPVIEPRARFVGVEYRLGLRELMQLVVRLLEGGAHPVLALADGAGREGMTTSETFHATSLTRVADPILTTIELTQRRTRVPFGTSPIILVEGDWRIELIAPSTNATEWLTPDREAPQSDVVHHCHMVFADRHFRAVQDHKNGLTDYDGSFGVETIHGTPIFQNRTYETQAKDVDQSGIGSIHLWVDFSARHESIVIYYRPD